MKSSLDTSSAAHFVRPLRDGDGLAPARERDERDERDQELWALAFTDLVVQRLPPVPPASAEEGAAVPVRNAASAGARDASGTGEVAAEGAGAGPAPAAGHGTSAGAVHGHGGSLELPSQLSAEVSDERFGRLQLQVARGQAGLDIVINVADSRVKALIEAEHAILVKTLKDAGLRVASVQIGNSSQPGTALALDRGGAERTRAGVALQRPNAKRRAYPTSREEEDDQSSEGFDFTA